MLEELLFGMKLTVIGVLVVFAALAFIASIITFIKHVDTSWKKREDDQKDAALAKKPNIDTVTLILIGAAVATIIHGRSHIRSIRRLLPGDAKSSPWAMEGRAVLHGSHVVGKKR